MNNQYLHEQSLSPKNNKRHGVFAFGLSLAVLCFALLILWLGQMAENMVNDKVVVREVAMLPVPPPPPKSVTQSTASEPMQSLVVQGAGASIQAIDIKVDSQITLTKPTINKAAIGKPDFQAMEVDWDAFSLNQLDDMPSLLTPVKAVLPKALVRQGVSTFVVKLDVFIDENGRLSLVNVIQNPYPEIKPQIDKIIRQSRFSSPQKSGEKVRARFIWPIEFKP